MVVTSEETDLPDLDLHYIFLTLKTDVSRGVGASRTRGRGKAKVTSASFGCPLQFDVDIADSRPRGISELEVMVQVSLTESLSQASATT